MPLSCCGASGGRACAAQRVARHQRVQRRARPPAGADPELHLDLHGAQRGRRHRRTPRHERRQVHRRMQPGREPLAQHAPSCAAQRRRSQRRAICACQSAGAAATAAKPSRPAHSSRPCRKLPAAGAAREGVQPRRLNGGARQRRAAGSPAVLPRGRSPRRAPGCGATPAAAPAPRRASASSWRSTSARAGPAACSAWRRQQCGGRRGARSARSMPAAAPRWPPRRSRPVRVPAAHATAPAQAARPLVQQVADRACAAKPAAGASADPGGVPRPRERHVELAQVFAQALAIDACHRVVLGAAATGAARPWSSCHLQRQRPPSSRPAGARRRAGTPAGTPAPWTCAPSPP